MLRYMCKMTNLKVKEIATVVEKNRGRCYHDGSEFIDMKLILRSAQSPENIRKEIDKTVLTFQLRKS